MNMNITKILVLLMCIACLSFAGISVNNYTVSQSSFQPGDVGVTTLSVTNPTGGTRVTGLTMTIYNPSEITVTSSPKLADIDTGGSAIVSIPFRISTNASPGIYLINVEFTGFGTSTAGQNQVTNTVSVPVTVVRSPIVSMNADTKVLGGVDDISLTITNNGGTAKQLRLRTSSNSSIVFYGANEVYIGDLKASKVLNLTLDSRNADNGPYDIPFQLVYNDELGITHTDSALLRMTVKKELLDTTFNQLSNLTTGMEGTLSLELVNNGDALSDVRLSFTNSSLLLKDSGEMKFGDLSSGGSKTVSATVYPGLSPGLNLVDAKVSWVEKDVRKEETIHVPLTISSDADVSVYLESKPSPLEAGAEHTISVLVSNIGSYKIDNVDVGMSSSGFELLDVTPRQYIGSLSQDDFSTVQFKVMMSDNAGTYPISINVKYRDSSGQWMNKTMTQNAVVQSAPASNTGFMNLAVVIVAAAAIAIWYFRFRKKG